MPANKAIAWLSEINEAVREAEDADLPLGYGRD